MSITTKFEQRERKQDIIKKRGSMRERKAKSISLAIYLVYTNHNLRNHAH